MRWFTKKLSITTGETKEITELESWTIRWEVKTGWSDANKVQHKVFIHENEAVEFEENLNNAAKLIGAWISTNKTKN